MAAARPISAETLVVLPRLSGISAARLARELLSAAKAEKKLPPFIVPDRDELAVVLEALHVELAKRVSGEGEDTPVVAAKGRIEDNAFGALFDFLSAWARLQAEKHPASAEASTVLREVFAGGLAFLAVRPHDEWQEAEIRLRLIADNGHEKTIAQLGGQPFLDHLAVAHKAYGEAPGDHHGEAGCRDPGHPRRARRCGRGPAWVCAPRRRPGAQERPAVLCPVATPARADRQLA
jgi:hypothetical protein